ncbi:hypothetical protein [Tautonia plasticadhaerens]|uniref:Uncharacterized protein n=1 Tax=Tautonia plasticadhaerens TaxID=2527974 RepID=A0A518H091_9BACT|nr:hypothetical protein [Tautonia plasticadhaerens]QDV34253.1 hypothetical protein ElP_21380 [Tautonia plasticadhaerens]
MTTAQTQDPVRARPANPRPISRVVAEAFGLLVLLSAVGARLFLSTPAEPSPTAEAAVEIEAETPTVAGPVIDDPLPPEAMPDPEPEPEPVSPRPTGPDPALLAAAGAELEAVRESLREAERQESELDAALQEVELRELAAGRSAEESARRLADAAERLEGAKADVLALQAQRDQLSRVIAEIEAAPRPREALNTSRSPVARMVDGEEFHFEVRADRVAFVDLDRLLEKAQADARLRLRMSGPTARTASGSVGPVGSFSLDYQVGPTGIGLVPDLRGPGLAASIGLQGFEVVPAGEMRGETFDLAFSPVSEVGRVIHRLNPSRTTITLWVYPDGFPMYRRLWDALHRLGFTVAARPLPEGMPIRGGPNGSRSSGQ